jgi:drug/metabolite transporter (DMT)-like permease
VRIRAFHERFATLSEEDQRPWIQIGRALLLVGGTASMFFALRYLPLAETYAITFISPFLVSIFAIIMLRETVSVRHWAVIGTGFCGALIVIEPGGDFFNWAIIFPIMMAIFWALYQVITRLIGASEPPLTTLFFTMLVGSVCLSTAVPFFWVPPDMKSWGLMGFMGVIGLVGQYSLIKAYALADASVLAPFVYTQIIWASLIGFFVFGDFPGISTLIGVTIIIASGLIIMKTSRDGG